MIDVSSNMHTNIHTVARLLLGAVQQMNVEMYRSIARALDYRLSLEMQENANNPDLVRAMRLIMIEHAVEGEELDADQERVRTLYENARPAILRKVQRFGVKTDDPRPLHALSNLIRLDSWPLDERDREIVTALEQEYMSLQIQLDSWPIGGRDREIVTALERAYQEMMPPPPDRTPPASGRARGR